jgi:hypothetical protein
MFDSNVVDWLLEEENPSIRYRTLTELLDEEENSSRVKEAKAKIKDTQPIKKLFSKMTDEGYWYYHNKRTGRGYGEAKRIEWDSGRTSE